MPLTAPPRGRRICVRAGLKKSISDQAPDSDDLYVKNATAPQPPPPAPPAAPAISFFPLPISVSFGASAQPVATSLAFTVTPASADLSAYAARIAYDLFRTTPTTAAPAGATTQVNVNVADVNVPLQLGVDESYTLAWPADGSAATITANTIYGAMMGLQTLSQAVRYDFDAGQFAVQGAPLAVSDKPKFAWRGILIDTDRHWLSLHTIQRIIDALGMAKLNILHWHIVDWQSWPLESKAYPKLWSDSWSPRERYTLADVASITAYAAARGVRVVPEFDSEWQGWRRRVRGASPRLAAAASRLTRPPAPARVPLRTPPQRRATPRACAAATRSSAAAPRAGPAATRRSAPCRTPTARTCRWTRSRPC